MYPNCKTSIYDNLIVLFDISKTETVSSNLSVLSQKKWDFAISEDLELLDGGLTLYDKGYLTALQDSYTYVHEDGFLRLYPVRYNDASGNTTTLPISITSTTKTGDYFQLSGGYLSNFFKLHGYNHELLPNRFINGFTVHLSLNIDNSTFNSIDSHDAKNNGIFFFIGASSEDKYYISYSGDSGYTTSNGLDLYNPVSDTNNTEYDSEMYPLSAISQNMNQNAFALRFTKDKKIAYQYVNDEGIIIKGFSDKTLESVGWHILSISFKPCVIIPANIYDKDLLNCYKRRKGNLDIYINGSLFHTFHDIDEIILKPLSTAKEKQIGIPYNISWGGGTFGLKHSYHFNPYWKFDNNNYFTDGINGTFDSNVEEIDNVFVPITDNFYTGGLNKYKLSIFDGESGIGTGSIGDSYEVGDGDLIFYEGTTAMRIYYRNGIGISDIGIGEDFNNDGTEIFPYIVDEYVDFQDNRNLLYHTTPFEILNHKRYVVEGYFSYQNLFESGVTLHEGDGIVFDIIGLNDKNGVTITHQSISLTDKEGWFKYTFTFETTKDFIPYETYLLIRVNAEPTAMTQNYDVWVDSISVKKYDYEEFEYIQDDRKNNLLAEKNFDGSYYGGIQLFMLYDTFQNPVQIRNVYNEYANRYSLRVLKGGR